jgi:DNA-binding winged helix-turn-helix (wHTH) protein
MNRIWPDTFVEEGNLTFDISVLRRTPCKDPPDGPYIETIPKHGYCFVASVP